MDQEAAPPSSDAESNSKGPPDPLLEDTDEEVIISRPKKKVVVLEPGEMYLSILNVVFLITSAVCGLWFGFVLDKSRAFEPRNIRLQMVFQRFLFLKLFLSALATSMFSTCLVSLMHHHAIHHQFTVAHQHFIVPFIHKNSLALIVGSLVLGMGMTLCGSSPSAIFVQLGSRIHQAEFTLLGAFLGNTIYSLWHDRLYFKIFPKEKLTLPLLLTDIAEVHYSVLALPIACALTGGLYAFENWVPWTGAHMNDLNLNGTLISACLIEKVVWHPTICGALIGLIQIPLLLFGRTMGTSSAFNTFTAQFLLSPTLQKKFPYLTSQRELNTANCWSIIFIIASFIGSLLSSFFSSTWNRIEGVPPHLALIGGAAMMMGTRISGGCLSHGMSGGALLVIGALLCTICAFIGGVIMGAILTWSDELENIY